MSFSKLSLCPSLHECVDDDDACSEGLEEEGGTGIDDGTKVDDVDDTKSPVPLLPLLSPAWPLSSSSRQFVPIPPGDDDEGEEEGEEGADEGDDGELEGDEGRGLLAISMTLSEILREQGSCICPEA